MYKKINTYIFCNKWKFVYLKWNLALASLNQRTHDACRQNFTEKWESSKLSKYFHGNYKFQM